MTKRTEDEQTRAVNIALDLLKLGVSSSGVDELLSFPHDLVEQQLEWLPFRKAKRPEALIIQAVRRNYSPPKELYYAPPQTPSSHRSHPLD